MRIDEDQAKEILTDVRRICRSSTHWPKCDVDDVEGDVLTVIFRRLSSIEKLQKPLRHFVRCTAKREAKKAFKKLASLRRRQRLEPDLTLFEQRFETQSDVPSHGSRIKTLVQCLPVNERRAVEEYFGFRKRSSTFNEYYRKELGVSRLRAQFDLEGEL